MIITLGTTPTVQRTMTFAKLAIDRVNRATSVRQFASGKSINVARVLHALGERVAAAGIVGGDSGKFMRQDMQRCGIAHDFITTFTPTRLCLTLIDESGNTATELIEEAAAPHEEAFDELLGKLTELVGAAKVLVMSGTLAPGAGNDFYAGCVSIARNAGVKTVVDARGIPLKLALAEKPTVVKPNRTELGATFDRLIESEESLRDAMKRVVELGAAWVVVTDGARDTIVSDGNEFWRIATPAVKVINPIGSGDSFAAGLAAGLRREMNVPDACALGVVCAAANAMTSHAGHVNKEDITALAKVVTVEET
ncbi:MAG: 1-phosphofructokinase family hexose kinase [Anaerolineae bacterium]|nr:1-phosphofructokinase family hexose kinase [Phycisphaerae bacterium]